jgi:peptide-methionine (R)-S-oxide reductase
MIMNRRDILQTLGVLPGLLVLPSLPASARTAADIERLRATWREFVPEGFDVPAREDRVTLSESQWRERLSDDRFDVLRNEATEPAFSSPLDRERRHGLYVCAGCDLPVFTSAMKYDSGTGWPSFFTTIPDVFDTKPDFLLVFPRTEYHCVRCGGHHGHLFDDGPPPTDERWCNNGLALRFIPTQRVGPRLNQAKSRPINDLHA